MLIIISEQDAVLESMLKHFVSLSNIVSTPLQPFKKKEEENDDMVTTVLTLM